MEPDVMVIQGKIVLMVYGRAYTIYLAQHHLVVRVNARRNELSASKAELIDSRGAGPRYTG